MFTRKMHPFADSGYAIPTVNFTMNARLEIVFLTIGFFSYRISEHIAHLFRTTRDSKKKKSAITFQKSTSFAYPNIYVYIYIYMLCVVVYVILCIYL